MDYFLMSDHSQTQFYPDEVSSMPHLIQQFGSDPSQLESRAQAALERLYGRYFDRVAVEVTADKLNAQDGRYNLTIDLAVVQSGKQHRLGRMLLIGDSKIISVKDPNAE
jgi:hypothetical protein